MMGGSRSGASVSSAAESAAVRSETSGAASSAVEAGGGLPRRRAARPSSSRWRWEVSSERVSGIGSLARATAPEASRDAATGARSTAVARTTQIYRTTPRGAGGRVTNGGCAQPV